MPIQQITSTDIASLPTGSVGATQLATGSVESYLNTQGSAFGFRNRIINGAMVIDQRNAGASVTPSTGTYTLDRYRAYQNVSGKFTVQQSSVAPPGFTNSTLITSTSAYTASGTDLFLFMQYIEGYNVADLGWGTTSAQTITLSFWVRSSLTGTFGGAICNSAEDRNYPFTYTISLPNTFEYKTITIAGDQSGTWLKTNGLGMEVNFGIGAGSTYSGTAGAWASGAKFTATGATSVVGTSGATFYITGIQLEKGSTATSFDYRPYGTELQLCQRYCFVAVFNGNNNYAGVCNNTTNGLASVPLPSPMRAAPTGTFPSSSYSADNGIVSLSFTPANMSINASGVNVARVYFTSGTGGSFTAGQAFNTGSGTVVLSSEL